MTRDSLQWMETWQPWLDGGIERTEWEIDTQQTEMKRDPVDDRIPIVKTENNNTLLHYIFVRCHGGRLT